MANLAAEILVKTVEGIATVTLNRPAKRNAVSLAMWSRLAEIFSDFGRQDGPRAAILTGAGGHFCAGADISEFPTVRANAAMGKIYEEAADAATRAVRDCPVPTIAAISGYAMGGGCGLALACDFRIGDASARMGIPAARLGIVYGPLDCSLLLRQVGLSNAKRILFSGRAFDVEDCRQLGLLDMVSEQGSALEAAHAFASDLSKNAPLSLAGAKLVLEALSSGTAEGRAGEIETAIARAMDSEDYREGASAFTEKRSPRFLGR
ncbi:Enoyl-CoA hydratase/carnithine racemase [Enhydrobacter aerosaccus]|uniref:Enoyl-CoA hydratase/carnithine racemase n=1 Tax=Enhydrobacter aerosaccus TaxID=225324 RepID=A0A1T4JKB6_9HYPH|nr:enoyl-CoA hydratase-related protein [Enhydrobacter aerosaccus]SJZ30578.1 Enoyl-CoA hydratase/carnithine racemase [Enhydrobacter aerosaccus]